jgi:hypothetical protein
VGRTLQWTTGKELALGHRLGVGLEVDVCIEAEPAKSKYSPAPRIRVLVGRFRDVHTKLVAEDIPVDI